MKSVIVLSDSHGNRTAIDKLFPLLSECDYIIHLGDTSSDGQYIKKAFGEKVYLINGNCDFMKLGQDEITLEIEGVKIFACHGDRYGVKRSSDILIGQPNFKSEELPFLTPEPFQDIRKIPTYTSL